MFTGSGRVTAKGLLSKWGVLVGGLVVVSSTSLVGCGDDDDNGGPIVVPTPSPAQFYRSIISLGNGQTGTVTMRVQDNILTGTIAISGAGTFEPGNYTFSGTVGAGGQFGGVGELPAPIGRFTVSGTLPGPGTPGTFTFTSNAGTFTGTIIQTGTGS
jgi:hypothetical protein